MVIKFKIEIKNIIFCSALTRRSRAQTTLEDIVALLGRERDEDAPQLRLLLAECFVAITM